MLNTKYIVYNPDAPPIENPYANGPAWFVERIEQVNSADEEIVKTGEINTATTAVVHSEFANALQSISAQDSTASIVLASYSPNHLKYEIEASHDGAVIFSEIYYPAGWTCYVDGKEGTAFRANYILRGVCVSKGTHQIEWKFEPASYSKGSTYSMAGSVLLVLLVLGAFGLEFRNRKHINA
jgi:hypothetical protein